MSRRGLTRLHEQLDALQETLQTFDDPDVDEHPGLTLMAEALRERTEHVRTTIVSAERSSFTVRLEGAAVADGSIPVTVLAPVLDALAEGVAAAAAIVDAAHGPSAAALHLVATTAEDGAIELELARPPGPLDAQLVATDADATVVDLAFEGLARALAGRAGDDAVAAAALPLVARLAAVLRGADLSATLSFEPVTRRAREVALDGAALARLVADDG